MSETPPDTLPAVREPTRLDELARLGQWLALSEADDKTEKGRGATAALRLYYAAELGLPPLASAELTVIRGRLYVGAQLLRALAGRAGYRVTRAESTTEKCTARLVDRNGTVLGSATFTIADAKKAGLVRDNSPWKTHPARMLWARASKNVIVDFAPEVALGLALDDEIGEITGVAHEPGPDMNPWEADDDIPFGDDPADIVQAELARDEG